MQDIAHSEPHLVFQDKSLVNPLRGREALGFQIESPELRKVRSH
jgi:hypothetical protein